MNAFRSQPLFNQQRLAINEAVSQASALYDSGQSRPAELICLRIVIDDPGQTHALHMLGLIAHARGDIGDAIDRLRQACKSADAPALYFSNLAEMLRRRGLLAEAEETGRKAVALDNKMLAAWNNLGIVLQESGKLDEALVCLQKVIDLEPNNAEAHNNIANTFKRLGKIQNAERHWKRALELNPHYAETYSNLANLYRDRGDCDSAVQYGQRAIDINPLFIDGYLNLAAAETERWQNVAALRWADLAVSIAPRNALARAARATVLEKLERFGEALADSELAIAIAPENADVQHAHGSVMLALGRFEEAIASFDRAIAAPSAIRETLLVARASCLQEYGRGRDALAALDDVIKEYPQSASALYAQADLVKYKADDPSIATMLALLGPKGLQSMQERTLLHFALGKAFLDIGDSDKAFRHLDEGNRMKRATFKYDVADDIRRMAEIAGAFPAELLERFAHRGSSSRCPIFVLGMPRSGTTLIEQILSSHPQIFGAGELKFLGRMVETHGGVTELALQPTPEMLANLGDDYARQLADRANGEPHVVDKMPSNFMSVGLIRMILPHARIIHARRDPVDTCLSCYSKLFGDGQAFTYDLKELSLYHRHYQELMAHWRAVVPATHFLEVDYEEVVDDIESQARRMIEFIGLPWDPACLDFHQAQRRVRTASVNQVRKPIYKSSSGRWRQHAKNLAPLLDTLGIQA